MTTMLLRVRLRGRLAGAVALLASIALAALGLAGLYAYGQDYNLHRGLTQPVPLPRAGTGRLLSVEFYSQALHRRASYMVYLPPGYNTSHRYPVDYLLHGSPGQPHVFVTIANMDVRLDNQLALGHLKPMILVYPDGRINGNTFSDSEWANTPSGNFESYVLEVVHNVDSRFSTLPHRADRMIGGFSAGAYGAVNIALHNLPVFGHIQSWSGYYLQTRTGVFAHATPAVVAANSPLDYIGHLRRALAADPVSMYMFIGRDDPSYTQQAPMARALRALGVPVGTAVYPGGHDWSVWYPRLNQMLVMASQAFTTPLRLNRPGRLGQPARPAAQPAPQAAAAGQRRSHRGSLALIGSLLLALVSGALINLGFVLQHRGLRSAGGGLAAALRDRTWLGGQALGWIGFAGQIIAIAIAPLTLVLAFAAGSFALSTPLCARLFGERVERRQLVAVAVIAAALATLPIGFSDRRDVLSGGILIGLSLALTLLAIALAGRRRSGLSAIAAGALYGASDAAIKACGVGLHAHGAGALLSGWVLVAALGTFGGFLAFQASLRTGRAVDAITAMNATSTIAAMSLGLLAFGESIGSSPASVLMHVAALVLVLAAMRPLVAAQPGVGDEEALAAPGSTDDAAHGSAGARALPTAVPRAAELAWRAMLRGGHLLGWTLAVIVAALAGTGLLYRLRELGALAVGPSVPDSLPLLQLAGFSGQPLLRVVIPWLSAGLIIGLPIQRTTRHRRALVALLLGGALLLLASDASYALARNLPFWPALVHRTPPLGAWLEALLLAAGAALPPLPPLRRRRADPEPAAGTHPFASLVATLETPEPGPAVAAAPNNNGAPGAERPLSLHAERPLAHDGPAARRSERTQ